MAPKKEFDYFDRPPVRRALWILLFVVCALTVVPDLFTHRHPHFGFDGFVGFYAVFGFAACAVLILLAKLIGKILKVEENYYDK
jgi:hypothetical protein